MRPRELRGFLEFSLIYLIFNLVQSRTDEPSCSQNNTIVTQTSAQMKSMATQTVSSKKNASQTDPPLQKIHQCIQTDTAFQIDQCKIKANVLTNPLIQVMM